MLLKKLKELKKIIPIIHYSSSQNIIIISNTNLFLVLKLLKHHINFQYNVLSCISGVDFFGKKYRFGVIYDLLSLTFNSRLRLKIFVNEITPVLSAISIYINANWYEREIWDLFGIYFNQHPDLRRLLTDYGFEGHPMRKDFPCFGFIELRYDDNKKRIIAESTDLAQDFRLFRFQTPW